MTCWLQTGTQNSVQDPLCMGRGYPPGHAGVRNRLGEERGCCISPPLQVARPENDCHTTPAELTGDLEADALIRARDEGDLRVVRMCNHAMLLQSLVGAVPPSVVPERDYRKRRANTAG